MSLFPLGLLSQGGGAGGGGAFELISTQLISSTTASVSFSSIVSTYKHLQIRMTSRTNQGSAQGEITMRFNGDTASNYRYHALQGYGSGIWSFDSGSISYISSQYAPGSTATANAFMPAIIDILDYGNTNKNKTTRILQGQSDSSNNVALISGLWLSTAAISSLTLTATGSFVSGSRISLYGVKGE